MPPTSVIVLIAALVLVPFAVMSATDGRIAIKQLPAKAQIDDKKAKKEKVIPTETEEAAAAPDHQAEVLADPIITTYGRANAFTHFLGTQSSSGGNVAVINQEGTSNSSVIVQRGSHNTATQTQNGLFNDIYLDQEGQHNMSKESQKGKYNRKRKIQKSPKKSVYID